jgi:hypothetical protein
MSDQEIEVITETRLAYRCEQENADKVYIVQIFRRPDDADGKYRVRALFGRRTFAKLQIADKTNFPVDIGRATQIFHNCLGEKRAKGYARMEAE